VGIPTAKLSLGIFPDNYINAAMNIANVKIDSDFCSSYSEADNNIDHSMDNSADDFKNHRLISTYHSTQWIH
jgi:hypothetical protein